MFQRVMFQNFIIKMNVYLIICIVCLLLSSGVGVWWWISHGEPPPPPTTSPGYVQPCSDGRRLCGIGSSQKCCGTDETCFNGKCSDYKPTPSPGDACTKCSSDRCKSDPCCDGSDHCCGATELAENGKCYQACGSVACDDLISECLVIDDTCESAYKKYGLPRCLQGQVAQNCLTCGADASPQSFACLDKAVCQFPEESDTIPVRQAIGTDPGSEWQPLYIMKIGRYDEQPWLSPEENYNIDEYATKTGKKGIVDQVFALLDQQVTSSTKDAITQTLKAMDTDFRTQYQSPLGYVCLNELESDVKPGYYWEFFTLQNRKDPGKKCPLQECVNYSLSAPGNVTKVRYNQTGNVCVLERCVGKGCPMGSSAQKSDLPQCDAKNNGRPDCEKGGDVTKAGLACKASIGANGGYQLWPDRTTDVSVCVTNCGNYDSQGFIINDIGDPSSTHPHDVYQGGWYCYDANLFDVIKKTPTLTINWQGYKGVMTDPFRGWPLPGDPPPNKSEGDNWSASIHWNRCDGDSQDTYKCYGNWEYLSDTEQYEQCTQ